MCGDYDSVIGMDKLEPITRFVTGMPKGRFTPAEGEATLCGVYRRDRRHDRPRPPCRAGADRRAAGRLRAMTHHLGLLARCTPSARRGD